MSARLVDFGRPTLMLRRGPFALRFDRRTVIVCAVLAVLTVALGFLNLMLGDYSVGIDQVAKVLTGAEDGFAQTVVVQWRAPRIVAAIVFGAAFGVAGAVFQSLTRNPLASPDVIGFATGSYTGALVVIIWFTSAYAVVAVGALVGGAITAATVYLLAYSRGLQGFRFIVVGIAVGAMLASANAWMLLVADDEVAGAAVVWGAGSLHAIGWSQTAVACLAIVPFAAAAMVLAPGLRQIEIGDDASTALGLRVERHRGMLIAVGVALTAAVTAAAGPIAFIALAAPQIGRRLVRGAGVPLIPAAMTGALLLLAADTVAQHLLPTSPPVGIVTVVIGGGYLIWLLVVEARRRL
ncbi:FecCD family ABC transporter permease [Aeromicrobium sp. UC242_57]|uniref:FecCD family ABC transporter permease n=1 Tax=Aeromicrobium sp. UC242_57 TaxID=3374624 RepID=UPI0037A1BA64